MIARVWSCRVPPQRATDVVPHLLRTAIAACDQIGGYVGAQLLQRVGDEGQTSFTLTTYWDSLDSVRRFAGSDITRAVLYEEDAEYEIQSDAGVTHYEVVYSQDLGLVSAVGDEGGRRD